MTLTKLRDRFTETEIDDEIIVMRLDTGDFYSLSGTAGAAWRLIDGQRDKAGLMADLAEEFDTDQAAIAADVEELLLRFRKMGLLVAS